jgi:hypothetical protein
MGPFVWRNTKNEVCFGFAKFQRTLKFTAADIMTGPIITMMLDVVSWQYSHMLFLECFSYQESAALC